MPSQAAPDRLEDLIARLGVAQRSARGSPSDQDLARPSLCCSQLQCVALQVSCGPLRAPIAATVLGGGGAAWRLSVSAPPGVAAAAASVFGLGLSIFGCLFLGLLATLIHHDYA